MMDKFFDALNVHNYTHGLHARKQFQMPYVSEKDPRLKVCILDIANTAYITIHNIIVVARGGFPTLFRSVGGVC